LKVLPRQNPKNKKELVEIKGIKEKKFRKYGEDILNMINGLKFNTSAQSKMFIEEAEIEKPHTVSSYLDLFK